MTKPLNDWHTLNTALMKMDEAACQKLLEEEQRTQNRERFVLRIHSRINRLRRRRERKELVNAKGGCE